MLSSGRAAMGMWKRLLMAFAWSLVVVVMAPPVAAQRVPVNSVLHECNRTHIHLVVRMDPWGAGRKLDPQFLQLGSCPASFENNLQGLLHFQRSLRECGFVRLTTGKMVEYSGNLAYRPPSSRSRFYSSPFTERVNCTTYGSERWTPARVSSFTGQLTASSVLLFTATLMHEDFSSPLDSAVFLLGSQIHIEFAIQSFFHQPLRIFVDECMAAARPELNKSPRNYSIITNHGCLVDGRVAASKFLPRLTPDAIRLSLQAFEFVGAGADIYLHCQVLVWDPEITTDPTRKACSFLRETKRWELLDNPSSSLCDCCDSMCQAIGSRHKRDLEGSSREDGLHYNVVLGRLKIQKPAQNAGSYEWDSNSSLAVRSVKGEKRDVMPPAVGALLLEVAIVAALSLGFCLYNGYQRKLCLQDRAAGDLATQGLVNAEQDCGSINADVE